MGFKTIRVETGWGAIEKSRGVYTNPANVLYYYTAKQAGLRFKTILGTSGPPSWYFEEYPDAKLMDQNGRQALGTPSYFAPEYKELRAKALDELLARWKELGFLDVTDTIVIDCGPAGEPLYPPAWTQETDGLDNSSGEEVFWGYDKYSQQNFRETMQEKYGTIAAANAAWGKSYSSFDQVEVPKPGNGGGGIWADYLDWYKQSKRNFVLEQVEIYKAAVDKYTEGRVKLILYIPGSDVTDEAFEAAKASGDGDGSVRIMADSRFLVDTAKEHGLYLQYTGFENASQTKYLRAYMDASGAGDIPFFGENAGGYDAVKYAANLSAIVRQNGMAGIDVTHSRFLFKNYDGMTPSDDIDKIKAAMKIIDNYLRPQSGG